MHRPRPTGHGHRPSALRRKPRQAGMHTETLECWAARLLRLLSLAAESCLLDVKLPPAPVLIILILIIDVDVDHANIATSRLDTTRLYSEFLGRADLSVLSPVLLASYNHSPRRSTTTSVVAQTRRDCHHVAGKPSHVLGATAARGNSSRLAVYLALAFTLANTTCA